MNASPPTPPPDHQVSEAILELARHLARRRQARLLAEARAKSPSSKEPNREE